MDVAPGILSDYSVVTVTTLLVKHEKGPGLWRFNDLPLEILNLFLRLNDKWNRHLEEQASMSLRMTLV